MPNVYLSKSRQAAIDASGKTILELIDLGLEAAGYEQAAATAEPQRRDARRGRPTQDDCQHPRARRSKGGLCMACGRNVG